MRNKSKTAKRLTGSIILIVVLALCLCLTTLAIVYDAMVSVENNIFTTGRVEINLNDGKAVYPEEMPLQVEPGATDQNEFFLKSEGTVSAYYRLYFSFNFDTENGELTQKGLADAIGVSQQSINKYENHNIEPDIETLMRIARF